MAAMAAAPGIGVPAPPPAAVGPPAAEIFSTMGLPDTTDTNTNFAIFMNRVIDITFYGSDKTGVQLTAGVISNIQTLAGGANPLLPTALVTRTNTAIEGIYDAGRSVQLINPGADSCGLTWAQTNAAPRVVRGTQSTSGGSPRSEFEGYRLAILQFMYNNYDIASFTIIPSGYSARVYYAAFKLFPLINTFTLDAIGPLYKEMLISLFLAFVKTVNAGAGALAASSRPLLEALTAFSKVNNMVLANSNLGNAPAFAPLIMPNPYAQKYLKYKQKYLALKK